MADQEGFKFNPAGVAAMLRSPAVIAGLAEIGKRGKEFAQHNAPYRDGDFARSIDSEVIVEKGIAQGILFSDDWRANILEKGGEHDGIMAPAFHTFGRATDYMAGGSGAAVGGGIAVHTPQGLE